MEQHDVIVIGAGHNGLTSAAYLVKAGLDVLVVEKNNWVGGGCVTREVTLPGFKHDLASMVHIFVQANPLIRNDELGLLSKYGLKYIYPDPSVCIYICADDTCFGIYRGNIDKTCEEIAKISPKDGENFRRFMEWARPVLDLVTFGFFNPPLPFGSFMAQLDQSEEGRELLRTLLMGSIDHLSEWFEDERIIAGLLNPVGESLLHPCYPGTAMLTFMFPILASVYGCGAPEGGSGMLSEALARCIRDNGGTIRTGSPVSKVRVSGGKAKSVILDTGEEIGARRAVVSNINIKHLLPGMIEGYTLDPKIDAKIRRLKHSYAGNMNSLYCLNEPPKFKGGEPPARAALTYPTQSLEEQMRMYDGYRFGRTTKNIAVVACQTTFDSTRAPQDKHTLYLYSFQPREPKVDGTSVHWHKIRERVADGMLETLRNHTTNMGPENILARYIQSPVDIERLNPCFVRADFWHISLHMIQLFSHRPIPEMGFYKTPIEQLWLTGASTHPMGGITCAPGRSTAMVMMSDLGIDFDKVIAK